MPAPKNNTTDRPKEKITDLKKDTVKDDAVKKGYNEKNPAQPQGAFKPDNSKNN